MGKGVNKSLNLKASEAGINANIKINFSDINCQCIKIICNVVQLKH